MNSLKLEKPDVVSLMAIESLDRLTEAEAELAAERRIDAMLKGPVEKKFADWAFEPGVGL